MQDNEIINNNIEEEYEKSFAKIGGFQIIFPFQAKQKMAELCEEILKSNKIFDKILSTNQSPSIKGGFAAEQFFAETFNLDAILKNKNLRAYTDNYDEWYNHKFNNELLSKNDIPDIIISKNGTITSSAQSKFYDSAENTAHKMSVLKNGRAKYEDISILLGPKDQIDNGIKSSLVKNENIQKITIKEHAKAKAEALSTIVGSEAEEKAYMQTANKVSSKIQQEDISSGSLTLEEDLQLGNGDRSKLLKNRFTIQNKSSCIQMGKAAIGAAAISAIVSGAVNSLKYIQLAKKGHLTFQEATYKVLTETFSSAADSAVKASANAGIQSLMIRYGSEKAIIEALAKQSLKSIAKTSVATIGILSMIEGIKDLVRLGVGKISKKEFYERQGKGFLMTSAGVMGGGAGAVGTTTMATAAGIGATGMAFPIVASIGGIAGGLIAGLAMNFAIQNGIEKPYRNLIENTNNLKSALSELEQISQNVFHAQMLFTKFLKKNGQMDKEFEFQVKRIDELGQSALETINRI